MAAPARAYSGHVFGKQHHQHRRPGADRRRTAALGAYRFESKNLFGGALGGFGEEFRLHVDFILAQLGYFFNGRENEGCYGKLIHQAKQQTVTVRASGVDKALFSQLVGPELGYEWDFFAGLGAPVRRPAFGLAHWLAVPHHCTMKHTDLLAAAPRLIALALALGCGGAASESTGSAQQAPSSMEPGATPAATDPAPAESRAPMSLRPPSVQMPQSGSPMITINPTPPSLPEPPVEELGSSDAGQALSDAAPASCDGFAVLARSCGGSACHGAGAPFSNFAASESAAQALVGQPSPLLDCSLGAPVINAEQPEQSLVIQKLDNPSCGARMPLGGPPLSAEEIACVQSWISTLASP